MSQPLTISFVADSQIKSWLERWAREDDRSISYVLRQILKQEAQRRASENKQQKVSK